MNKPQLLKSLESISSFIDYANESIKEDSTISGISCSNMIVEHRDYPSIEIRKSFFENMSFDHCNFEKASFVDVIFQVCDLSNSQFKGAYFERCQFNHCKGVGIDMSKTLLKHVSFEQSNLQYAYFEYAKLNDIEFNQVNLTEVSFSEAQFKNFSAHQSKFINNNFFKTVLDKIDFSDNDFINPIVSNHPIELKGVILNSMQAVDLVSLFGIVVKD
jgi:uncharacterized protein YjbI with pentapeptide repeats